MGRDIFENEDFGHNGEVIDNYETLTVRFNIEPRRG